MQTTTTLSGGIVCRERSASGREYYLICSRVPWGQGCRVCYSVFCHSPEGAAFYFDLTRDVDRARGLVAMLGRGDVAPEYLEEVLEEL